MEGHPNAFSKQTNCFSSPPAKRTWRFLDRRKPPRKCRLKECSPGETWYVLICWGEMAPTFEPSRKTLTTPPSPIAGLRRWARPRPSRDTIRTTTRVGNAGQIRFGARRNWMVASSMPSEVSPPLVAATTSDRSWFIFVSYTDRCKKNSNKLMKSRLRMLGRREQSTPESRRMPLTAGCRAHPRPHSDRSGASDTAQRLTDRDHGPGNLVREVAEAKLGARRHRRWRNHHDISLRALPI